MIVHMPHTPGPELARLLSFLQHEKKAGDILRLASLSMTELSVMIQGAVVKVHGIPALSASNYLRAKSRCRQNLLCPRVNHPCTCQCWTIENGEYSSLGEVAMPCREALP
eukprot:scaffold257056_cov36-Tisochrysis_lutea.AAC.1